MSIRAVRKSKGLTQLQLANKSGVSREQINKYERGHRVPELGNLIKIRDALGSTLDELVSEDEEEIRNGA